MLAAVLLLAMPTTAAADHQLAFKAGAAQRDITPPVGYQITHYERISIGVHDPLFARVLYLEDHQGNHVAIVGLDLIGAGFEACDQLRAEIKEKSGVENTLLAFSHNHSSVSLMPRPEKIVDTVTGWNHVTHDAIVEIVREAKAKAEPVTLRMGRAEAQVGFNRRLVHKPSGNVYMGVNKEGPVVPWVNVLVADSRKTGRPIAVLFEHAAHPVIVPHTSQLTSADYPGAAAARISEVLGDDVVAVFGQGGGGNINGYPLRSTHELADAAGRKLGDAALAAVEAAETIESHELTVKFAQSWLPSNPPPTREVWQQWVDTARTRDGQVDQRKVDHLNKLRALMEAGENPPPRRFDAYAVMIGREWCLVTMPHEMFCQYELWIDEKAPFRRTMTFAYTNGGQGYVAVDEAWKLKEKGGYEAGSLPNWGGNGSFSEFFGPPAVGSEKIIKDTIASLWPQEE
ncbi:MAG: hypothetical protein DWQ31_03010 [Planctomycetota bacterium]|nr:MAG: hypothetical protein DWQ31_03010 [Planctomycetota bacterium]REJ88995.1 MAG: hypothetical protein DWQ35_19120 [Planctomycetota bacterium]